MYYLVKGHNFGKAKWNVTTIVGAQHPTLNNIPITLKYIIYGLKNHNKTYLRVYLNFIKGAEI